MDTKDIILELRTKKGLSQDQLAEKAFVTRQAVSRWENGETIPNTETLKLLSTEYLKQNNLLKKQYISLFEEINQLLDPVEKRKRTERSTIFKDALCNYFDNGITVFDDRVNGNINFYFLCAIHCLQKKASLEAYANSPLNYYTAHEPNPAVNTLLDDAFLQLSKSYRILRQGYGETEDYFSEFESTDLIQHTIGTYCNEELSYTKNNSREFLFSLDYYSDLYIFEQLNTKLLSTFK